MMDTQQRYVHQRGLMRKHAHYITTGKSPKARKLLFGSLQIPKNYLKVTSGHARISSRASGALIIQFLNCL